MAQVSKKVLADMHVPPALRRWTVRVVLALAVALAIAYAPGNSESQTVHLQRQLEDARREAVALEADNAKLAAEVDALRTDPRAVESRARNELGMVYPGEIVLRLEGLDPGDDDAATDGDAAPRGDGPRAPAAEDTP